MVLFGDADTGRTMAIISLTIEQWSDPHGDLDAGPALATYSLTAEFLTVAGAAAHRWLGCRLLVLKFVGEFLRLTESNLRLKASTILLVLQRLLLLLQPV